jgi:spermidine/putrescine transport system permease protein
MALGNDSSEREGASAHESTMRRPFTIGSNLVRLITILVYLFLYFPIVVIVIMSFYPGEYMTFPLPSASLRWYGQFFQDKLLIKSVLNSLGLGITAAVLSALIGTPCAIGLVRTNFPGKKVFNTLILAPMIIPQIITGISLLILLNSIHLPKGYFYLVIGHVMLTLPYIIITVSSQLYGFNREIEEAALSLGANEIQTFFEVTLPIIAPSIFAGMLFAFTVSFQEFVATQAWATPDTATLPIRIYGRIRDALTPEINVVGVLMVALAIGVAVTVQIFTRKEQEGEVYGA